VTTPTAAQPQTLDELLVPELERSFGLALHLTGERAEAEDLVQDAALAACRGFGTFKQGTRFRPWFLTILTNCFYARYRRARREGTRVDVDDAMDLYLYERTAELGWHDGSADPAERLLGRLESHHVQAAVRDLPEEFRVVAVLGLIEDLSYAEIADVVGVPIGTVRSRLHRGRKLIQRRLWQTAVDAGLVPGTRREEG
jgi:RNA polymerase sigma-70 factor (ECF subfamily)